MGEDSVTDPINGDEFFYINMGIAVILSGILIDKLNDIRIGLLCASSFLFLALITSFIDIFLAKIIAEFLLYLGFYLGFICCSMNIGILFPVANNWKDNAFLIFNLAPIVGLIVIVIIINLVELVNLSYQEFASINIVAFFSLAISTFLIFKFQNLGYSIEEDEGTSNESYFIFFGLISFLTIIYFSQGHLIRLGETNHMYSDSIGINDILIQLIPYCFLAILIYVLIKRSNYQSEQIKKLMYLLYLLIAAGITDFIGEISNHYELDFISNQFIYLVTFVLITPVVFSIYTHLNINKKAGTWFGVIIGIPFLLNAIPNFFHENNFYNYYPYIAFVLLILLLIWTRENQEFIENKLLLHEPNRDLGENEESEDPFDHLVEE